MLLDVAKQPMFCREKPMVEKKFTDPSARTLLQHKNSLYLCLPQPFCERHGLKKGDRVMVSGGENLKVVPMERENG